MAFFFLFFGGLGSPRDDVSVCPVRNNFHCSDRGRLTSISSQKSLVSSRQFRCGCTLHVGDTGPDEGEDQTMKTTQMPAVETDAGSVQCLMNGTAAAKWLACYVISFSRRNDKLLLHEGGSREAGRRQAWCRCWLALPVHDDMKCEARLARLWSRQDRGE